MDSTSAVTEPELLCPLCEYNLRGLTEPRCPECGHRSTWEELRRDQPNHPYLFERYPQRNVWSFWRTLIGSLRPRKFWRQLSPTVLPVPRRLSIFGLIIVLTCLVSGVTFAGVDLYQTAQWYAAARQKYVRDITAASTPGPKFNPDTAQRVAALQRMGITPQQEARRMYPAATDAIFWRYWLRSGSTYYRYGAIGLLAALWPILTLASLLVFRISLRQKKIQTVHVVRCVVYTSTLLAMPGVAILVVTPMIYFYPPFVTQYLYRGEPVEWILLATLIALWYRLGVAYAKYLRFDQPYLTALASQVMVLLALWKVAFLMRGM
jgi:hypothetical protein